MVWHQFSQEHSTASRDANKTERDAKVGLATRAERNSVHPRLRSGHASLRRGTKREATDNMNPVHRLALSVAQKGESRHQQALDRLGRLTGFRMPNSKNTRHILMIHGWLRGNLGDACIEAVVLQTLGKNFTVDVVAYPFAPFEADITQAFHDYDAVVVAPGGGIQNANDMRAKHILRDVIYCAANNIPCMFASHSFDPMYADLLPEKCKVFCREPVSHRLLPGSILTADLAWLQAVPVMKRREGHLVFLRHDNYSDLNRRGDTLFAQDTPIVDVGPDTRLCSSDWDRDSLETRSGLLSLPFVRCDTLEALLQVIGRARRVSSDRYHPAIFARMMGCETEFLARKNCSRDMGLLEQLTMPLDELQSLAAAGLNELVAEIHRSRKIKML